MKTHLRDSCLLTIVTPTYNRCDELINCYKSLLNQTDLNFQWLIIDDGSSDNTKDVFSKIESNKFTVDYYYKKNGGKHTALNFSHKYIKGSHTLILDSDDQLTENAVEKVKSIIYKYEYQQNIGCFSFLKAERNGNTLGRKFDFIERVSNHIDLRINKGLVGDYCEIIKTTVFKEFPFPEFEGERFFSEGFLWIMSGLKYDTVYINEVIYIADYLDGGLTKLGRKLRIDNPIGSRYNAFVGLNSKIKFKYRIKHALLFDVYSFFTNKPIKNICLNRYWYLTMPLMLPSFFLYIHWFVKYLKGEK